MNKFQEVEAARSKYARAIGSAKARFPALILIFIATACGERNPTALDPEGLAGDPKNPSGVVSDRAVAIDPGQFVLESDRDDLAVGVYRYRVLSPAAPSIAVGQYVFGRVAPQADLYIRRVTYSVLEDGVLTLGTVEGYWPEILEATRITVSASAGVPASSLAEAAGVAAVPLEVEGSFALDLCVEADICNKNVSISKCDQSLKGIQICGTLTKAEVTGSGRTSGNIEFVLEIDPGQVIPGQPAVYYPCNQFPAACLYTGVCIVGTPVVVSVFPFRAEICTRLRDAVPPTIVPPFIRDIGVDGSNVALAVGVRALLRGNFRLEWDLPIPRFSVSVPIPKVQLPYPLDNCKLEGEFVIGDVLHLEAELLGIEAEISDTVDLAYNVGAHWGKLIGFSPSFNVLRQEADASIAFQKPDSLRMQVGILAKVGAAVRMGGLLQPLCPILLGPAIIEALGGDVIEDVYTRPVPCATEFNQPVAPGCTIDNYKHDIDVFGDFQFRAALHGEAFGQELVDLSFFRENTCKHIPPYEPGSCRLDIFDLYGRGELEVNVESSLGPGGKPNDLDEAFQVTLSRAIRDDPAATPRLLWEPVADPTSLTMDVDVVSGAGRVAFSDHPQVTLFPIFFNPNLPGPQYYGPLCKSRLNVLQGVTVRTNCTLVGGMAHTLTLEGVAANCQVKDAVLDPRSDLGAERSFYRIIQLQSAGGAPIGQAQPNVETFEVLCTDDEVVFGNVAITAVTTGVDLDQDGYDVLVKPCSVGDCISTRVGSVGANGSFMIDGLLGGERTIFLDGASRADNCTVVATTPDLVPDDAAGLATIQVVPMDTVALEFRVQCGPRNPGTGAVHVSNATGGKDIDPDGYYVTINGVGAGAFESNGDLEVGGLAAGAATVALLGVAENCTVSEDNPRAVVVSAGATTNVHFDVTCTAPQLLGTISVSTITTGRDLPAEFTLLVGGASALIGANASITVDIEVGATEVGLVGVAPNCSVAAPNPRSVVVVEGGTTPTTFEVTCKQSNAASSTPIQGMIQVQDVVGIGNEGKPKKRLVVTDQVLNLGLTGSLSGTGTLVRSYNLDENGSGQAHGSMELVVSFNGRSGTVSGNFSGKVVAGSGNFSYTGQGAGGLDGLKFFFDFAGPLESPYIYTGRALDPNKQGS